MFAMGQLILMVFQDVGLIFAVTAFVFFMLTAIALIVLMNLNDAEIRNELLVPIENRTLSTRQTSGR